MTTYFEDGFESGDFTAWTASGGAGTEAVATGGHHGTYRGTFAVNSSGKASWAYKDLPSTYATAYARCYFKLDLLPSGDTYAVGIIYLSSPAWAGSLVIVDAYNNAGTTVWRLLVYENTTWVNYLAATGPSINTWYCVELYLYQHDTNGAATLWIDGVSVASTTGKDTLTARGAIGCVPIGVGSNYNGTGTITVSIDCVVVSDAYIGPEAAGGIVPILLAHRRMRL